MAKRLLAVGDKVRLAHQFCDSVQADNAMRAPTGTVVSIHEVPGCKHKPIRVDWHDDGGVSGALEYNLEVAK